MTHREIIREEIRRMLTELTMTGAPPVEQPSKYANYPGAPPNGVGGVMNNEARDALKYWVRFVHVCEKKFGTDPSTWSPKAVKVATALGQAAQDHLTNTGSSQIGNQ